MTPDSDAFRLWAGTDQQAISGDDLLEHNWSRPGPHLVQAYHGSTHRFTAFDPARCSHMGHFGNVHYFTTCIVDARMNYANPKGPDLCTRVAREAERLAHDIENDPAAAGLSEDADYEVIETRAEELARARLVGPEREVMTLFLRLDKPFVIDAAGKTDMPFFEELLEYGAAMEKIAAQHGLTLDEIQDREEEFEDEIHALRDEAHLALKERFDAALWTASRALDCECPDRLDIDDQLFEELNTSAFNQIMRNDSGLWDIMDDEGEIVAHSLISGLLAELGYDSIVLLNADLQFPSMRMSPGTTHVHIMGKEQTRIKSISNRGSFDPANPDITL